MPFSKRKPYLRDVATTKPGAGNMRLKKGISSFFRSAARYLKESNEKESQFEKPYQVGDYPAMHLNLPTPSWPRRGYRYSDNPFTPGGPRSRIHTIIYADPSCHAGVANLGCGDSSSLGFSIWSTPPHALGGGWEWEVFKQNAVPDSISELVTMGEPVVSGTAGQYVTVFLDAAEEIDDGTIVICAKATWASMTGYGDSSIPLKSITVDVPEGTNPFIAGGQALGRPHQAAPIRTSRELSRLRPSAPRPWDFGAILSMSAPCCQDVEVVGCCSVSTVIAWNDGGSDDTIARSGTATVAITGSSNSDFTWSVSGTGFTLDYLTTSGLSNTLNADAAACGAATITVTGCDGTSVTGYVRCTTGTWGAQPWSNPIPGPRTGDGSECYDTICTLERIEGQYKVIQIVDICRGTGSCDDDTCSGCDIRESIEWDCTMLLDFYGSAWVECGDFCCSLDVYEGCNDSGYCWKNKSLNLYKWECA